MRYRTIVADPPWPGPVGDWRTYPLVVQSHSLTKFGRKASGNVYPLMTLKQIKALCPPTEDKAHLWLWTLSQHIDWGWETAKAWGFYPLHLLAWCKPGFGTGGFQSNTEYIIVARKGGPQQNGFKKMAGTHYAWPRCNRHSGKPDEFFNLVEQVSPGPYLEMFARKRRKGWAAWGNERNGARVIGKHLASKGDSNDSESS